MYYLGEHNILISILDYKWLPTSHIHQSFSIPALSKSNKDTIDYVETKLVTKRPMQLHL